MRTKNQVSFFLQTFSTHIQTFMLNKPVNKYSEITDVSIGIHHWEMTWMKGIYLIELRIN